MPKYKYHALALDSTKAEGIIDAYDELAAVDAIRESFPIVVDIREVKAGESILALELGSKKIDLKQLSILCSQFSIVLTAGMPIARAVRLMAMQCRDKKLKKLLSQVADDVGEGYSLADSFENKGAEQLPATFIETIRAGETSGTLEQSFANLQGYFEKQAAVRAKVRSALAYPVFLLVLAAAVIAIIMGVAMPVFTDTFADMGTEMPAITKMVIAVADFFAGWWWLLAALVLALVIGVKLYSNTETGRLRLAKLRSQLPLVGEIVRMKASSQFASTISTLLTAGLPLVNAVSVSARVLDNYYLGMKLAETVPRLEEGRALYDCMLECGCFPELLVEMTGTGEETGTLEGTLKTVGNYFDQEVNFATARAVGVLQPAILIVMGIVIGFVVIAMYLPMFTMYSGMA